MKAGEDRRRFPRFDRFLPPTERGDSQAGQPLLINMSAGGICLWLPDPPTIDRLGKVRLYWDGQEQALPVRPVWVLKYPRARDTGKEADQHGWLVGFAFPSASADPGGSALPWNIPPSTHIAVDLLQENNSSAPSVGERGGASRLSLDSQTIDHLKVAAESLFPVLSRHFADAHLAVTCGRLELSATFRSLAELNGLQGAAPGRRAIQTNHASSVLAAPQAHRDAGAAQWTGDQPLAGRRLLLTAATGLLIVVLGWNVLPGLLRGERASPAVKAPTQPRPVPGWAAALNPTAREGWMDLQARFGLTDATVSSAIRILKVDDKYPPGHMYRDLTVYPVQIRRAFGILADLGAAGQRDLKAVTGDLGMRLVSGARFPDEPPGDRHSELSRELNDNSVVLAVVDLLFRHRNDPAVRDLLNSLWQAPPRKGSDQSTLVRAFRGPGSPSE